MNLAARLLGGDDRDPAATALLTSTAALSYGELRAQALAVGAAVRTQAAPGGRVAILATNEPAFVAAYLGTLAAGSVAVPLNPSAPARAMAAEIAHVGATLVLVPPSLAAPDDSVRTLSLDAAVLSGAAGSLDGCTVAQPNDLAVLLFTSGTAGRPKAAQLTHGCLGANLEQVQRHPGLALRSTDIGLGVLPFFHVFGLNVALGLALYAGASVSLVEHFSPAATLAQVRAHRVSVVAAVPAVYSAWLESSDTDAPADSFASVRLAVSGAAPLGTALVERFAARFGVTVHDGYGLTEASPIVTTTAVGGRAAPPAGSIGPPLPGIDIRLVDTDGHDVLEGDPGEIWVRGDNVFAGYDGDPGQTAAVLAPGGWLRTGDIAVADAQGWLSLVDRAKDLVIVSGFNVFPAEVEDALREHHDVAGAAVVGEPDPRSGEHVVAFVVARAGTSPTATQLTSHLRKRIARYKIPARFEFVDELPHTFAGKVLRRALRETVTPDATAKPA